MGLPLPLGLPQVPAARPLGIEPAALQLPSRLPSIRTARPRRAAAARTRALSQEVASAIDAAGPASRAQASTLHGLGARLIDLLTRSFSPSRNGPVEAGFFDDEALRIDAKAGGADPLESPAPADPALAKKAMLQVLDYVAMLFSAHYAPLDWKRKEFGLELTAEYEKARAEISALPEPTTRDFQDALARFVAKLKDYHVGVKFYSTEAAMLPISIVQARGRFFLAYVDREVLPESDFPFQVGDEVLAYDGVPAAKAVAELVREKGPNSEATDVELAAMRLTRRIRAMGDRMPEDDAELTLRTQEGDYSARIPWTRQAELIPQDIPLRDAGGILGRLGASAPQAAALEDGSFYASRLAARVRQALLKLIPSGLNLLARMLSLGIGPKAENPFQMGARRSFVPPLGKLLWKAGEESPFHAYIYQSKDGRKIGYVRVAAYLGGAKEAEAFGELMSLFQQKTEALVFDQVNNPGGDLFFMYALLSRMTDRPLDAPDHRVAISEEDASEAIEQILSSNRISSEEDVLEMLGETISGYAVTYTLWKQALAYAKFIYKEFKDGRRLTRPIPIAGVDRIEPNPGARYTKPIVVLANALDFSCADLLPAILQDNRRAVVFGSRTSGAGGAVKNLEFPNQFGIAGLAYTWTIALRPDGSPVENNGVAPDRPYEISESDLLNAFAGYKKAVNDAVAAALIR
jgi:hypothetical protein